MKYPNFRYEKAVWGKGYEFVAGIDEVGRGALAGPVVAGCVVFKKLLNPLKERNINAIPHIDDSKKLTPSRREIADLWIKRNAVTWGIAKVSASDIDKLGIVKAANKAIRKAISISNTKVHIRIQYLLIDAFYIPYIRGIRMPILKYRKMKNKKIIKVYKQQTAIVKGDQKSFSIACASIIAKVYRDKLMVRIGKNAKYKKYKWERNKGYGTEIHKKSLMKYGYTSLHRKSFLKFLQNN